MYITNIITYTYSIFILGLILFSIRSSTKTVKNEKFKLTLYCALFYFLLEILWNIIDSKNIYMGYILNRVLCILLLITESVLTYLWYDYFKSTFTRFTNLEGKKIRHINFWEKIPLILLILTSLTAFFSDYIFSIDDNNCYVAGKGFWIYIVSYFFYPLVVTGLALYIFKKTREKATKKQALFFVQFFTYLVIAGILMLITKINSFTGVGISLALLSFYISL